MKSLVKTYELFEKTLVKAIFLGTKIIFVGDPNQLPSVGPGSILKDLIDSNEFATVHLDKIFRQAAKSKIIVNAHNVNNGINFIGSNDYVDDVMDDFFYVNEQNQPKKTSSDDDCCICCAACCIGCVDRHCAGTCQCSLQVSLYSQDFQESPKRTSGSEQLLAIP